MSERLAMKSISKSFGGAVALADGCLTLQPGKVHALMGANGAGKSTLMNVLGGVLSKDGGTIAIDGQTVEIGNAAHAASLGIAFVHQELTTMPTLSVAENIFLGDFPKRGFLIDRRRMNAQAKPLLDCVGCQIDPRTLVETLSTGDRQLVEIARAIRKSPRIIILDEPTSSLSGPEREKLFAVIDNLKKSGAAIVFISHFLDEVFRICDEITVMRNGRTVGSWLSTETSMSEIVHEMLGSVTATERIREPQKCELTPLVTARDLTAGNLVRRVSIDFRPGEIVGLWGLLGSGRTEFVRALIGLDDLSAGNLQIAGAHGLKNAKPAELRAMTGLVTEDRRKEGVILPFSIAQNIGLPNLRSLSNRLGVIDRKAELSLAQRLSAELGVKSTSALQTAGTLSGGNQQKVVFGKWLPAKPTFFILDEPTRGLDTGAKGEILKLTVRLAEEGAAVLFISSELEELMRVADRYVVINRGAITHEFSGSATHEELMNAVSEEIKEQEVA
ncbi:sugar ABC transporter ATP-binding protein [Brucella pseudogrignonensis]|uniref:sugar ABC transporter ATP-binding protein n=1 Tax=Brucella pseudogrignonensis TaxID=419475 RepID=UPI0028BB14C4|nr:sugar ABC transporter ATP-binding protein [Brucella pseudogrignonensis]MDT6942432.1 sugar ABC transporter ATP-binding protein [Brucella pseudogrignonensis]